jgi:hypothetical protein
VHLSLAAAGCRTEVVSLGGTADTDVWGLLGAGRLWMALWAHDCDDATAFLVGGAYSVCAGRLTAPLTGGAWCSASYIEGAC